MERLILKDFHIGSVENVLEHFCVPKEPQAVFNQLARAIKSKKSEKEKKNWNALVKQKSVDRDPIGTTKEFEKVLQNRKSLRKSMKVVQSSSNENLLGKFVEYLPHTILAELNANIVYI